MWRSRWRCMIKPAYSVSFLLSINIFVWQNVLYFLDAPRTNNNFKIKTQYQLDAPRATTFKTLYFTTYFSLSNLVNHHIPLGNAMLTSHPRLMIVMKYRNPQRNKLIKLHILSYTVQWNVVMRNKTKLKQLDLKTLSSAHNKVYIFLNGPVMNRPISLPPQTVCINGGRFCETLGFRSWLVDASFLGCGAASLGDTHRPVTRHFSSLRWVVQLNFDIQRPCDRPLRHRFSWFSSVLIKNFSWFPNLKLILYASHEALKI